MLTRGRLVPRQPRAIKRTTRTELHRYNIHPGRCVHRNTGITLTALHGCNIYKNECIQWNIGTKPITLPHYNIPLADTSNGIPPQYLRRCVLTTSVISYISITVSTMALISLGFISPVICANLQPFSPVINTPISVMSFSSPFASTRMSLSASLSLANS